MAAIDLGHDQSDAHVSTNDDTQRIELSPLDLHAMGAFRVNLAESAVDLLSVEDDE